MDNTQLVKNVFDKHATAYQEKFMDVSLYHGSLDLFCKNLSSPDAAILELACGPGNITRYLLEKCPMLKIHGIDISENMIALAKKNNPEGVFEVMDCRGIGSLSTKYNALMAGFCFPYLSKEEVIKVIADAAGLLEPHGVIYFSTMEADYSTSGWRKSSAGDNVYMYNHEEDYMAKALEDNGFRIADIQRKQYPGRDGETVTDLIMVGIRQ